MICTKNCDNIFKESDDGDNDDDDDDDDDDGQLFGIFVTLR